MVGCFLKEVIIRIRKASIQLNVLNLNVLNWHRGRVAEWTAATRSFNYACILQFRGMALRNLG